jgi:hypothetical protein
MNKWNNANKFEIHLELSSLCQAMCPACSRIYDYNEAIPKGKKHSSWDLNSLHKTFNKEVLKATKEFLLCGNYGDPLAFNDLDQWISDVLAINPDIRFWIHTNGGLGSLQTWRNLGAILNKPGHNISFSFDGLEDTNLLYRRGVDWQKAMKNAKAYLEAGGLATWKFIDFSHNHHQIEEARELAEKMGFKNFKIIPPYSDEGDITKIPSVSELPKDSQISFQGLSDGELQELNFKLLRNEKKKDISCEAIRENSIYVDCDKKLWPCCWMARTGDHRLRLSQREEFYRKVYRDYGLESGFNFVGSRDLFTTLEHPFFQNFLPSSWKGESIRKEECLSICLEKCSRSKALKVQE